MKPWIIAEAAQGYEGSADIAELLVRAAGRAGADAVKFQIVFADDLAQPGYQHFELFGTLEMSETDWRRVRKTAEALKIAFIADVFGPRSVEVARQIAVDGVKLHSTTFFDEETNRATFDLGVPVYASVGGITADEISAMLDRLSLEHKSRLRLLYGYQSEPTPIEDNNLARVRSLRELTGLEVGFMDHTDGGGPDHIALSVMALGMGIRIFEKHITLDRGLKMEDFVSALATEEFREYVTTLQRLAAAIGDDTLELREEEQVYRQNVLKRATAARDLEAGTVIGLEDISLLRAAGPDGAVDSTQLIGGTLVRAVCAGDTINISDLKWHQGD
jgi:sialic acid synthase SpsE